MTTAKGTDSALAQQLAAGIQKHFSTAGSLTFGNETFTPAQVEAFLQTIVDLRTAVEVTRAANRAKVMSEETQGAPLRRQMAAFVAFVKVTFGNTPDVLADFGLRPRRESTPLTIDQKAAAAARRAATRAARHTMGAKQKKSVKGTVTTIVTGVVVTPVTAPSPPVTAPSSPTAPATSVGPTAASSPTSPAPSGASSIGAAATPHTA